MMTYDEFKSYVIENLEGMLPEGNYNISLGSSTKLNGQEKEGVIIRPENGNCAPIIYMDEFFDKYLETGNEEEILFNMADIYAEHGTPPETIDYASMLNFESTKDKIRCRLVNADMNRDMLDDIPHKKIGELAVTYHIQVDDDGMMSTKITNELMEKYGVSVDDLHKVAIENQNKYQRPKLISMEEMLHELTGMPTHHPEGAPRMYILSTEDKMFGAAALINPEVTEQIANEIGDVYALPSSVHEWVMVPVEDAPPIEALKGMIEQANDTVVEAEELLSYNLYKVDKESKTLEIAQERENDYGEKDYGKTSVKASNKKDKAKVYDEAR